MPQSLLTKYWQVLTSVVKYTYVVKSYKIQKYSILLDCLIVWFTRKNNNLNVLISYFKVVRNNKTINLNDMIVKCLFYITLHINITCVHDVSDPMNVNVSYTIFGVKHMQLYDLEYLPKRNFIKVIFVW